MGLEVVDSYQADECGSATLDGREIRFTRTRHIITRAAGAEVLATDSGGDPFVSVHTYGKGRVYFVNAPIEKGLLSEHGAFEKEPEHLYRTLFGRRAPLAVSGKDIIFTYHPTDFGYYLILINTSDQPQRFTIDCDTPFSLEKVYYGNGKTLQPYDACVLALRTQ